MTDRIPDPRIATLIADALQTTPTFFGPLASIINAHDIASALSGVVVLKTDLKQVGHLTKNGWLIENSHDDPGRALTHDAAPVFVLVEPEVAGFEGPPA